MSTLMGSEMEQGEKIDFMSANPFSFYHIITELNEQDQQDTHGILRMPDMDVTSAPLPMIIGVNGSKNWSAHHLEYLKMFRENG